MTRRLADDHAPRHGSRSVGRIDMVLCKRTRGPAMFAGPRVFLPNGDRSNYLTVTTPFMFMARCGVQKNGYSPAATPANEIV